MTSLKDLAKKYNVDKESRHNYMIMYDNIMSKYRPHPIKLLEIGIDRGNSLKMWGEFFSKGRIYGIDSREVCIKDYRDNVSCYCINQKNANDLDGLGKQIAPLEFIIDDGSHKSYDQIFSFYKLFMYLKSGGYYFIEDIHTSFIEAFAKNKYEGRTCFEFFVNLSKSFNLGKPIFADIHSITFSERIIIVRKK